MGARTIQKPPFGDGEEEVKAEETETETEETETEEKVEEEPEKTETETETKAEETETEEEEEVDLKQWYEDTQADFDEKNADLKKQLGEIQSQKDGIEQGKLELEEQKKEHEKYVTKRNQEVTDLAERTGVGEQFKQRKDTEREVRKGQGAISSLFEPKEYYSKEKPPMVTDPTTRKSRPATAAEVDQMNFQANAKENTRLLEAERVMGIVLETQYPGLKQVIKKHEADEAAQPWFKTSAEFRKEMSIEPGDPVMEKVSEEIIKRYLFNGARSDDDRRFIIQGLYSNATSSGDINDTVTSKREVKALPKGAEKFKVTRKKPPPKQVGTKGGSSGTSKAPRRVQGRPLTPREIREQQG